MRARWHSVCALTAAVTLTVALAVGAEGGGSGWDLSKRVWFHGEVHDVFVLIPALAGGSGPMVPSDEATDVDVYLVGEIDPADPFGSEMKRPAVNPETGAQILGPDGQVLEHIVIPAHDDTFSARPSRAAPGDTRGLWVVAGGNATPDTVKLRPMPAASLAGAPLAWAVRLDGDWHPLTDHRVVERGLEAGLLRLEFSNWGGLAWLEERD